MSNLKKIILLILGLIIIIILDIIGFILIEQVGFMDAFYMTMISITTVGYKEVFELSQAGRLFTLWVILSGLVIFFYSIRMVAEHAFEGNIRRILGRRKMKTLLSLKNHVVVAGFGVVGEHVCRELEKKKIKIVIIENDTERYASAEERRFNVILGNATDEEILDQAGIRQAKSFISLLSSDADNILAVMSAREENHNLFIIARAQDSSNKNKLFKTGADRVITPNELSSRKIVTTVLQPNVVDFIELMTYSPKLDLSLEELTVSQESPLAGKTIIESNLRSKYDIMVIAIKRDEEMFFNPSPKQQILANDILILVGDKEKLLSIS